MEPVKKSVLILGRRDPTEAMRVAAGLTIYDHRITLVLMLPVPDTPENQDMMELLEFSDIEPKSAVPANAALPQVGAEALAAAILDAHDVIST